MIVPIRAELLERRPHLVSRRADIGRKLEVAHHRGKPIGKFVGHPLDQECHRPQSRCAPAPARAAARGRNITGLVAIGPLTMIAVTLWRPDDDISYRRAVALCRIAEHQPFRPPSNVPPARCMAHCAQRSILLCRNSARRAATPSKAAASARHAGRNCPSSPAPIASGSAFRSCMTRVRASCPWRPSPTRRPTIAPAPRCGSTRFPVLWCMRSNIATGSTSRR